MLLQFQDFVRAFKAVFFVLGLFLTLAFGNYFKADWVPLAWMFGFSAIVGFVFRNKKEQGVYYFLAPTILLPGLGFAINFQLYFALELVLILAGYFIGNAGFESRKNTVVSLSLLVTLSVAVFNFLLQS